MRICDWRLAIGDWGKRGIGDLRLVRRSLGEGGLPIADWSAVALTKADWKKEGSGFRVQGSAGTWAVLNPEPRTLVPCFFLTLVCAFVIGCSSPGPAKKTDPEIANYASTARVAFNRGSVEQAARLYQRALDRARAMDSAEDIALCAYNLAACRVEMNRLDDAAILLAEARRESVRAGLDAADIALLEIRLHRIAGRGDDAMRLADHLLANDRRPEYRLQAHVLKGGMDCDKGDPVAAGRELDAIDSFLPKIADPVLRASVKELEARMLLLDGRKAEAAKALDEESSLLAQGGRFRDMARALNQAGTVYKELAIWPSAWDRYYRAARSLFAQGDGVGALKAVEAAVGAAEKLTDDDAQRQTAALFQDVKKRLEQAEKATTE